MKNWRELVRSMFYCQRIEADLFLAIQFLIMLLLDHIKYISSEGHNVARAMLTTFEGDQHRLLPPAAWFKITKLPVAGKIRLETPQQLSESIMFGNSPKTLTNLIKTRGSEALCLKCFSQKQVAEP